ncbi:hypothetical protein B5P19_15965 [Clavibacter sepedonicus]|uniref:Membrane protein n=1 Tax=Clavibacter sepedonicus TaxID=31964 RepID=B0RJ27_CLASE|nr:hypothetical protein B5P19_15965 [Clavibacter sepedonicus]OQJ50894.1 hypothetical protein B5P20_15785 [Clavibacter sepedonicus]CAQ03216.1 putative membrane protein [Clavibacter sepedonicus]
MTTAVCIFASGVIGGPLCSVAAHAASLPMNTGPSRTAAVTADQVRAPSDDEASATETYWSDDRLRAAEPDDDIPSSLNTATADSAIVHAVSGSIASVPWVGTLAFIRDGRDKKCSAAAVQSDSGLMVATAGHCLVSDGKFATSVAFTPGWDGKGRPC